MYRANFSLGFYLIFILILEMENGKFALQNALLCVLVGWTIDDLEQPKVCILRIFRNIQLYIWLYIQLYIQVYIQPFFASYIHRKRTRRNVFRFKSAFHILQTVRLTSYIVRARYSEYKTRCVCCTPYKTSTIVPVHHTETTVHMVL